MSSGVYVIGRNSRTRNSDRIRSIKEQLWKLEKEHGQPTQKFHQKRTSLLRLLNDEQALTKNLVSETISLIFQHTYSRALTAFAKGSVIKTVLALGSVSFQWRQIAWSTPQLWMKLDMDVKPHTMLHFVHLLQLHLTNARSHPFSLSVGFSDYVHFPSESLSAFSKVLLDSTNAPKLRSLSLDFAPQQLILDLSQESFSHLEDLRVRVPRWTAISDFILMVPCLRKLRLNSVPPAPVGLSWSILTSLHLSNIPINICTKSLTQCTNLIEACILNPVDATTSMNGLPWATSTDTITFPLLETFTWTYRPDPIYLALFQRIHAPSLRTMDWYGVEDPVPEGLQTALANEFPAPSTLTELRIRHFESLSLSFFQRTFARTEHLQTLKIDCCDAGSIMNALSSFMPEPGSEEQVSYLPSLTRLEIYAEYEMGLEYDWSWRIFEFLERQWRRGIADFDLDLSRIEVSWDPSAEDAIWSLVEEGFDLSIYDNGDLVEWLCQDTRRENFCRS